MTMFIMVDDPEDDGYEDDEDDDYDQGHVNLNHGPDVDNHDLSLIHI